MSCNSPDNDFCLETFKSSTYLVRALLDSLYPLRETLFANPKTICKTRADNESEKKFISVTSTSNTITFSENCCE